MAIDRRGLALLATLALAALSGAEVARLSFWTTSDEPLHLASAREWRHGPGIVSNFEHPVLMKVLAGLPLPAQPPERSIDETRAGRAPFEWIYAALVFVAGAWTARRAGTGAGLAVAALLALEPTLRGHAALIQSDVLVTACIVAATAALDVSALSLAPNRLLLAASGVLYGLALASKFSALPFLGVFFIAAVLRVRSSRGVFLTGLRRKRRDRSTPPPPAALRKAAAFVLVPALLTAVLVQAGAMAATSAADFRSGLAAEFHGLPQEADAMSLAERLPKWAAAYGAGLLFVQAGAAPGERANYFIGKVSGTGFPLYFPVALAVKLTTAAVVAILAALAAMVISLARPGAARRRRLSRLLASRALLPAGLGLAYLLAAMTSNLNIGVRHALPVVPFALVAAAGAGRTLLYRKKRVFRVLLLLVVLAAAGEATPRLWHKTSFRKPLLGGPRGVPRVLSDSNVDWGQEQGRLFDRVRRGDLGRVGIVTMVCDIDEARAAGVAVWLRAGNADVPLDTVFFSRFTWDLARAIEKNHETSPKFMRLRDWLPPLARGFAKRAGSVEPFGDAYLLFRLNPVKTK